MSYLWFWYVAWIGWFAILCIEVIGNGPAQRFAAIMVFLCMAVIGIMQKLNRWSVTIETDEPTLPPPPKPEAGRAEG